LPLRYRLAEPSDATAFDRVGDGLFDKPVDPRLLTQFLHDPRHHIAIADEDGMIVGFVSAVDYVHPDKPRQLFINEVGVSRNHRGRGVAKHLMEIMIDHARSVGCSEAWVLTEAGNEAANALYRSAGAGDPQPQLMYAYPLT
jgi:ribosomal protein S18 acetylase RimI-like enzyme